MTRHPLIGLARMLVIAQLAPVIYFGVAAWVGSSLLVDPPDASRACRTPAHLGWSYESINYERATDLRLLSEPDPMDCMADAVRAGNEVLSTDGVPLAGWWIPAAQGADAGRATVVLVHGYADNKSGMLEYAVFFHERYDLVLFDLRNSGQSGGRWTTQGVAEQHDLAGMLDWLVRTHDPRQIVVFGQSMGGETAVNAAAADPRVDAVILDSTHDRLQTPVASAMDRSYLPFGAVAYPFIVLLAEWRTGHPVAGDDPIDAVGRLAGRPVLLLHGGRDAVDPVTAALAMRDAAEAGGVDVELEICAGADHGEIEDLCRVDYQRWLDGFLVRALGARSRA